MTQPVGQPSSLAASTMTIACAAVNLPFPSPPKSTDEVQEEE